MPEVKERVLLALAMRDKSDLTETVRAVTEASAEVLGVDRASVWRVVSDPAGIVCEDLYSRGSGAHSVDEPVLAETHPAYFAALGEHRTVPAVDASDDPRTAELTDDYLKPRHIVSMMDVPIWHRGALYGVLCNEHAAVRVWRDDDVAFATNLADIVSLSLEASERRAAELQWAAVVDAIGEGVFVMHTDGTLYPANAMMRAKVDVIGGSATLEERERLVEVVDLLGRPVAPEDRPMQRALRGETVVGEILGFRPRGVDAFSWFRMTITPIGERDRATHWVGVLGDLSDEVRFAQIKRRFLDDLAHELKTPVATVTGYAYVLAHGDPVQGHPEALDAIRRATDRMARLVHGLVDVSAILLGRVVLRWERIRLSEVARRTADRLAIEVPGLSVDVREIEELEVVGDRERLELAFLELVEAILSTGGHATGIDFLIARDEAWAVVTIRVRGLDYTPDPTEPRLKPLSQGTAGAPIVPLVFREVVLAHRGHVAVESNAIAGTTVRIALPALVQR